MSRDSLLTSLSLTIHFQLLFLHISIKLLTGIHVYDVYRMGQIKRCQLSFLLVTTECRIASIKFNDFWHM